LSPEAHEFTSCNARTADTHDPDGCVFDFTLGGVTGLRRVALPCQAAGCASDSASGSLFLPANMP